MMTAAHVCVFVVCVYASFFSPFLPLLFAVHLVAPLATTATFASSLSAFPFVPIGNIVKVNVAPACEGVLRTATAATMRTCVVPVLRHKTHALARRVYRPYQLPLRMHRRELGPHITRKGVRCPYLGLHVGVHRAWRVV